MDSEAPTRSTVAAPTTRRRIVVAVLGETESGETGGLAAARAASLVGDEVIYLGASSPRAVARAAEAEDAVEVHVVGSEAAVEAVARALADLGIDDIEACAS